MVEFDWRDYEEHVGVACSRAGYHGDYSDCNCVIVVYVEKGNVLFVGLI